MNGDFVGACAVNDKGAATAKFTHGLGNGLAKSRVGNTHDLVLRTARGEQRAKGVEQGGHAQGLAHRLHVGDRRVVGGGEKEGEVGCLELSDGTLWVQVERNVQGFQHVSGAGLGRDGTVTALDHLHSPSGSDEGGGGGDVDGVLAVTTRAGGVHEALTSDGERTASGQEGLGGTGDIGEGFTAGAYGGKEGGDVDIVVITHGERGECLDGLL